MRPDISAESMTAFDAFGAELGRLVELFGRNLALHKSPSYSEARLRMDFLDPFFRALGWDVENKAGLIPQHREVEIESPTRMGDRQKRADYLFRTDRQDRFVCEAKKPAEELDARHAFQAKRYAWNKGLVLAVLTDFEEIKIYIVGSKPHPDEAHVGLWKTWHFQEYAGAAHELWDVLARPSVAGGSIDKLVEQLPRKPAGKGKARAQWLFKPDRARALDTDFLNFLDEARRELASDLIRHNDRQDLLQGTKLNEAVQRILDRLLFLRICEDRDIDTGRPLALIVKTWRDTAGNPPPRRVRQSDLLLHDANAGQAHAAKPPATGSLWREVVAHFRALDRRPPSYIPFFNGNLFKPHFSEELEVSDVWISGFLDDVGDEESPYLFNVIPVEILGTIYERFLGKVVRPKGRGVMIEEKPEVRKAGGVYYTPRYIVDYIVEQTVGKLLEDKTPKQSLELRVLDPACGSGSFLIRAFERVCEHWQAAMMKNEKLRHPQECWIDQETGDIHLTTDLKRRILTANIYGVDIDQGAVEVTQLSLYLKMLEGENRATMARERDLFGSAVAILPPLEENIKCGNSLIASDFSMVPEELLRVNAFDWEVQFREIMKRGGFDAVIGNPPYVRIQGFPKGQVAYFVRNYEAATGNYDLYVNFVERGFKLLGCIGRLGMILPNKFCRTDYGVGLRRCLSSVRAVERIIDFGSEQVFQATTYTCLLFLTRQQAKTFAVAFCKADPVALLNSVPESRSGETLGEAPWTLLGMQQAKLLQKVKCAGERLLDLPCHMSRGSSSGDDDVFVIDADTNLYEPEALRIPLFASDFGRYFIQPTGTWRIIYPYSSVGTGCKLYSEVELQQRYPRAFAHLHGHSAALKRRKQYKEWFGYSAPRNLELHDRAQIAVPLLANKPSFAFIPDSVRGMLCPMASGGFTIYVEPQCGLKPEFILGLVNSKLLFWCLRQVSNVFRGGWITCTKQYFGELSIVSLKLDKECDKRRHERLVGLVDKMLVLMPKLRAAKTEQERAVLQNAVTATDRQIDALVYELYGLTPEEIELVENG